MSYPYLLRPRESQLKAMKEAFRSKRRLIWGVPGTGKTKIALDFIGTLRHHNKIKKALVVCPAVALGVWEDQIQLNCPNMPYQFLRVGYKEPDWSKDGIIITNYDYFIPRRKKRQRMRKRGIGPMEVSYVDKVRLNNLLLWDPDVVVIDEGHKIKNPYSRSAKATHKLGEVCEYALDLTGTPMGNKKRLDLWSHFRFLKPDLLNPTFKEFKEEYGKWGGFGGFQLMGFKNTEKLDALVKPYITVIRKKGIERKTFIPFRVDLPPKAKSIYEKMEDEFVALVEGKEITAAIALAKLVKLQQISGGFIRSNEGKDLPLHSAKLDAVKEIVEELKEADIDRLLIFARFIWEVDAIKLAIADEMCTYRLTGNETPNERKLAETLYNSNGGAAIIQIAAAESLSFNNTDYAIFYSADHSHIHFTQAQYRIDRDEVTHNCFYYLLQAKGTVDARIYRMLREHRDVSNEIQNMVEEIKKERAA